MSTNSDNTRLSKNFIVVVDDNGNKNYIKNMLMIANIVTRANPATVAAGFVVLEAYKWYKSKDIDIYLCGEGESESFIFPLGHPRQNIVYVRHPAMPKKYIPLADFHRIVFESKFCEVIELLRCLGAEEIIVESKLGWSRDMVSNISVPKSVDINTTYDSKTDSSVLYRAKLKTTKEPYLPDNRVWFNDEQAWQMLAEQRMNGGSLKEFDLRLCYADNFGVDMGLKVKVEKSNFGLGGSFQEFKQTEWNIRGRFK